MIADGDDFVDDAAIQNRRREACADALDLVRARLTAGQNLRILRLHRDNLDTRLALFQHLSNAGNRAPGADARDEEINLAFHVVPDFFGGGLAMNFRIGGVFELLRNDGARRRRRNLIRLGDGALHALRRRRQHEFGAEQGQHLAPLDRHGFGHHEDELIAARGGDKGQREPRVAGGRLHQNAAPGADLAFALQRLDHRQANAILNAGKRIEKFELGEEIGFDAFFRRNSAKPDDRRIANGLRDRIINSTPTIFLSARLAFAQNRHRRSLLHGFGSNSCGKLPANNTVSIDNG